ncbi:hypothetical protein CRG98_042466 [Punica granatum]|uniref:Uncharacterized protein n=1 Tax=Punica granatum TaxID=22663 RepID=A0A2I0HZJ7_PUNGR|nr:hypothetical protein CRG98_042466 [Punica granatum]
MASTFGLTLFHPFMFFQMLIGPGIRMIGDLLDGPNFYKQTVQIHAKTVKHGLELKNTVCNAMITSYSECGSIEDAKKVLDGSFLTQDIVTRNSMLGAYLVHGKEDSEFKLFILMQQDGFEPDIYTYSSMRSACFEQLQKSLGTCLHGLVIKRGLEISVPISNALIVVYLKSNNRSMEEALCIFESIKSKDRFSWNSILTGYSQFGLSEDTLNLFARMSYLLVEIDHYSFSAVLKSCSVLATLQPGQEVHALALKTGFEANEFVAVLTACSHTGLVEEGEKLLQSMDRDYGIPLRMEHYACAIDLFGRSGCIDKAKALIESMPFKPDPMVWKTLLGACRTCGDIELARTVASELLELEPEEHCTYILLSDVYGILEKEEPQRSGFVATFCY